MATIDLGILKVIPLSSIEVGTRAREDAGDIPELAKMIEQVGLIHPIAVYSPTGEAPYKLLAGGRRYMAMVHLQSTEISARIFDKELTEEDLAAVELYENTIRKDFSHAEQTKLTNQIHNYLSKKDPKHSMRDTARFLKRSVGSVSGDIKLANAIEQVPEMGLQHAKNKSAAMRRLERAKINVQNHAVIQKHRQERIANPPETPDDAHQRVIDSYHVGDFFQLASELPDGQFQFLEVDPPWGIDEDKYFDGVANSPYQVWSKENYPSHIQDLATECWRLAAPNSWLIWWFGFEWHMEIYEALMQRGFKGTCVPAIWQKEGAHPYSRTPHTNLSSDYESFLYVRKGGSNLAIPARSNVFRCPPIHSNYRIHSQERPRKLMVDILDTFTHPGAQVCVPFAGSGTTLRAAWNSSRIPWGSDSQQEYKNAYTVRALQEWAPPLPSEGKGDEGIKNGNSVDSDEIPLPNS